LEGTVKTNVVVTALEVYLVEKQMVFALKAV
jgi:hypothetical protein